MDEKEFKRKVVEEKKTREQMLKDKQKYDRAMHSEDKTWSVDYKTGTLQTKEE